MASIDDRQNRAIIFKIYSKYLILNGYKTEVMRINNKTQCNYTKTSRKLIACLPGK